MKFFNILKKIGSAIIKGVKVVIGFITGNKSGLAEAVTAVGAIATIGVVSALVCRYVLNSVRVHDNSVKTNNSKGDDKFYLDANGRIRGNTRKKYKVKSPNVIEQFKQDLRESSKFFKVLSQEEREDVKKIWKKDPQPESKTLETTSYATWNPRVSVAQNEINEIRMYVMALDKIDELDNPDSPCFAPQKNMTEEDSRLMWEEHILPRIRARYEVLSYMERKYAELFPSGTLDKTDFKLDPDETPKEKKARLQDYADKATFAREAFDANVSRYLGYELTKKKDEILEALDQEGEVASTSSSHIPQVDPEKVAGWAESEIVSQAKFEVDREIMDDELPRLHVMKAPPINPEQIRGKTIKFQRPKTDGDRKRRIQNIREVPDMPDFFWKDPEPEKRRLGNIQAEDFKPIGDWEIGMPHKFATDEEIAHNYDWSEFEGYRSAGSRGIRDAYVKGIDWCRTHLDCAIVFDRMILQDPVVYPDHPQHDDFMKKFRECYWDLVRVVPGLGNYGRVCAQPFGLDPDEPERMMEIYHEMGDLSAIYGMNNPPSPEKVFYEIMRYGGTSIMGTIHGLEKDCPAIKAGIENPSYCADIMYQMMTDPQVISAAKIPDELVSVAQFKIDEYFGDEYHEDDWLLPDYDYDGDEDDDDDDDEENEIDTHLIRAFNELDKD